MYNQLGYVAAATRWTEDAIFCYNRGCICSNCPIQKLLSSKCRLKRIVIALVTRFGKPKK